MQSLPSPLFAILKQRAIQSLANPNEINDEVLNMSLTDSNEACKGRDVPYYIRVDFAYIRLKLYLKIDLNGEDEMLFKHALNAIEKSEIINDKGEIKSYLHYQSAIRGDIL